MREELRFAGLLHPLKTPHHKPSVDPSKIRVGDVRQAAVVGSKGRVLVDAGLKSLIPLEGDVPKERRITVQFTSNHPNFRCKAIAKEHVKEYWGYEVKEVQSLVGLLESAKNPVILTSREGEPLGKREREIIQELKNSSGALIVFGSPNRGLREILKDERRMVADFKYFLNFVPSQGTETVRLEESVLGCLSILNYLTSTNRTL
jgi:predicted SPOUT superfamily RNA methylase MTH1